MTTVANVLEQVIREAKAPRRIPDTRINPDGVKLRRFERQGEQQIARALDTLRRSLFAGLNADTVGEVVSRMNDREIMQPYSDVIAALIQEWALFGADFGREQVEREIFGTIKQVGGIAIDWALANDAAVRWAQGYSFELITGITGTLRTRLQREVSGFAESGETFQAFSRRLIASDIFSAGQQPASIAVTEVTRSVFEGSMQAWKESGVVAGKEWNTANDEIVRKCPICWPLHNKVVPIDENFESQQFSGNGPPGHPRCRCWGTPVTIGDI